MVAQLRLQLGFGEILRRNPGPTLLDHVGKGGEIADRGGDGFVERGRPSSWETVVDLVGYAIAGVRSFGPPVLRQLEVVALKPDQPRASRAQRLGAFGATETVVSRNRQPFVANDIDGLGCAVGRLGHDEAEGLEEYDPRRKRHQRHPAARGEHEAALLLFFIRLRPPFGIEEEVGRTDVAAVRTSEDVASVGDDVVEWKIDENLLWSQSVLGFSESGDDFGKLDRLVVDFRGHVLAALHGPQLPQEPLPHESPGVLFLFPGESVETCDEACRECVGPVMDAPFPDGPGHGPRPFSTRPEGDGFGRSSGFDNRPLDLATDDAQKNIVGDPREQRLNRVAFLAFFFRKADQALEHGFGGPDLVVVVEPVVEQDSRDDQLLVRAEARLRDSHFVEALARTPFGPFAVLRFRCVLRGDDNDLQLADQPRQIDAERQAGVVAVSRHVVELVGVHRATDDPREISRSQAATRAEDPRGDGRRQTDRFWNGGPQPRMREDLVHFFAQDDEGRDGLAGCDRPYTLEVFPKYIVGTAKFGLVPCLDQSFGRVAEGTVPDVVEEGGQPRGASILVAHRGYVLIVVSTEAPPMGGVPFERPNHALRSLHYSPRVFEAVMAGSGIYEMSHPELTHPPQPLEQGSVQQHRLPR